MNNFIAAIISQVDQCVPGEYCLLDSSMYPFLLNGMNEHILHFSIQQSISFPSSLLFTGHQRTLSLTQRDEQETDVQKRAVI